MSTGAAAGAATGGASGSTGSASGGAAGATNGPGATGAAGAATSAGAAGGGSAPGLTTGGVQSGAASSGQSGSGTAGAGATATDWTSSLNDDFKGFVQNKGWKAPSDAIDSYRNLEKLVGTPAEQVIKLPKDDDAAGWESVHTRLGRPATPEGYKLEIPKEGGSPEFAKWASEQFYKAGLSEKQGQSIVKQWNEYVKGQSDAQKEAYNAKVQADQTSLKREWGAAYEQNMAISQRAAREFGVDVKVINAMEASVGFAATMKFFNSIGSRIGEARFVDGTPGTNDNGPMTPAQAKAKLAQLGADPAWVKRYSEGGAKERAEMERIQQYANPQVS